MAAQGGPRKRILDPERTRQDILDAAREEFAQNGLSGARMDAIAARTRTVKRMIYYYFGSKDQLYLTVLEDAYRGIRQQEQALGLEHLPPVDALRRLVEFTFDYEEAHPEFVRLVGVENIHHGRHVAQSDAIKRLNNAAIGLLTDIMERGKRDGVFRPDADPVDVHMMISAFCFFRVSNQYTFGILFDRNLSDPALRTLHKRLIADAVIRAFEHRRD